MAISQKELTKNILSPKLNKGKALFLKRLGALLEEGYSIKQSLVFIEKFESDPIKSWIGQLQEGLLAGKQFHEELEKMGYPNKTCSQIYLASQSGNYGKVMKQCGEDLLEQERFKKKLVGLLSYPFILLTFLFGMLLLMRFLILPNMAAVFESTMSTHDIYSDGLVAFVYYSPQLIVLSLLAFLVGYFLLKKRLAHLSALAKVQYFADLPIIKAYLKNYWTHFLFLEWGQLLRSGLSFQELVHLMSKKEASAILKETAAILANEMIQGKSVKESLTALPFIEEEALAVISHGENLGQLSTEMLIYASYCETELTEKLEKLLEKLQPLIFIFIAFMIIAIYASMILPIYTLMEGI